MNPRLKVGQTPLIPLTFGDVTIWGKAEFLNPSGSVKDRPISNILKRGFEHGLLKKGDTVIVRTGKDAGKKGEIVKVVGNNQRVIVEKVNLINRHLRQDSQGGGGIIEKESTIHISNVNYFCNKCNKPTRISRKILDDARKVRACRHCGEIIDA